jgi:mono/diheme cytochrome c family protein
MASFSQGCYLGYTRQVLIHDSARWRKPAMTFVRLALLVVATALFVIACNKPDTATTNQTPPTIAGPAATPANAAADELATARTNFTKNCAGCHGDDGTGGPRKLDNGKTLKVPSLREGHALNHKDEDFVKQITNGGDGMPKFGDKLSREEIIDLVRFIRKEFQGK